MTTDLVCLKPAPPVPTGLPWDWTIGDLIAALAARLRPHDQHEGATADWHPLADLPPAAIDLDQPTDDRTDQILTAVTDELGQWVPELYDLEPAHLYSTVLYGTDAGAPFREVIR